MKFVDDQDDRGYTVKSVKEFAGKYLPVEMDGIGAASNAKSEYEVYADKTIPAHYFTEEGAKKELENRIAQYSK